MGRLEQPASPHLGSAGPAEDTGPFQVPADWAPPDRGEGPDELRARRRRALGYGRGSGYKGRSEDRSQESGVRMKRRSVPFRYNRGIIH
jgi:hypothetical protein